jgi:hypothetical protein
MGVAEFHRYAGAFVRVEALPRRDVDWGTPT